MRKFNIYYGGITKIIPDDEYTIEEIIELIKTDLHTKTLTKQVREIKKDNHSELKKERNKIKKKMLYVTPAGIFEKRHNNHIIKQSGYAPIDIDYVKEDLETLKEKLKNDPYIRLLFISPSGEGLKAFIEIPIDPNSYTDRVKTFYEYLYNTYKINLDSLDPTTCDISRACFLGHDSDVYYNPNSSIFTSVNYNITLFKKKDMTRSAKEFTELLKLIYAGRTKEYIFQYMDRYSKWKDGTEAYKEYSYNKAFKISKESGSLTAAQKKAIIPELARTIMDNNYIVAIRSDKSPELWIYRDGIYIPEAISYIQEMLGTILKDHYDIGIVSKVIDFIKKDSYQSSEEFFKEEDPRYICVENGILDIFKKELYKFSPGLKFFNKLPVKYSPDCTCENTEKHFETILNQEDIPLMQEIYGYLLYRNYNIQKAFMFSGDGGNGKGKTLEQMHKLIGSKNVVNVSLHSLEKDYFIKSSLHKKLANLGADLGKSEIKETSTFRELTGEDLITASRKFLSPIEFKNYAKMIFAVNTVPYIDEDTDGFWRRWIYINFPVSFLNKNDFEKQQREGTLTSNHRISDIEMSEKLTNPRELSGVLNWALEGLNRLLQNKDFSYNKSYQETKMLMQKRESSAISFMQDCLDFVQNGDYYVTHDEMYAFYRKYCMKGLTKMKVEPDLRFRKHMENHGLCVERKRIASGYELRWYYVQFNKEIFDMVMTK